MNNRSHRRNIGGRLENIDSVDANFDRLKSTTPMGGKEIIELTDDPLSLSTNVVIDQQSAIALVFDLESKKKLADHGIIGQSTGAGRRKDRKFYLDKDATAFSTYDMAFAYQLGLIGNSDPHIYQGILAWGVSHDSNYMEKLSVYLDLRKDGLLVMPGTNYGVDFVVYTDSPDQFMDRGRKQHSKIMIDVSNDMSVKEAIKGEQLAKNENKEYMVAKGKGSRDLDGYLDSITTNVSYSYLDMRDLGMYSNHDISAQIAKRMAGTPMVAWELRRRYND